MSKSEKQTFVLINDDVRRNAVMAVAGSDDFATVTIRTKTRSLDQNAKLHAMLTDLSKSHVTWAGKRRTLDEWKALIISGHSVATGHAGEIVPGLENEFVAIRESSATMSVARAASLITYLLAFCDMNGVELTETKKHGFLEDRFGRAAA